MTCQYQEPTRFHCIPTPRQSRPTRARAEGKDFIVEGIAEPARLPTYNVGQASPLPLPAEGTPDPAITDAIKVVIERLQSELDVIEKTGFISYFLIVADFIRHGRQLGISCVARGSAAGSLVTYLLEIANVDSIRYGLLFERFLNPERVNPLLEPQAVILFDRTPPLPVADDDCPF